MIDLEAWTDEEQAPLRRAFRQAVRLVLRAIARSPALSSVMVMKGGILLAIRYRSSRFTRDIDFSTPTRFQEVDLRTFLRSFAEALEPVSADNEYGLALSLQSHAVKPPNKPDVMFPTLKLRVAYANRRNPGAMRRLATREATDVVDVDYSFNEWASEIERSSAEAGELSIYPFHDLIAEKLRSVLQQVVRNRDRFQDVYDLYLLLEGGTVITAGSRAAILAKLRAASADRAVPIHIHAMRDAEIIDRSRRGYESVLPGLVQGDVPPFDAAYGAVQSFFESLPWTAE